MSDTLMIFGTQFPMVNGIKATDSNGNIQTYVKPENTGGGVMSIVDTLDSHGGVIRTITGVSLAGDTVTAAHLESGYTAHDANGNAITGTLSAIGGDLDLPIFTITFNSDVSSITSITCDKTYSECVALLDAETDPNYGAITRYLNPSYPNVTLYGAAEMATSTDNSISYCCWSDNNAIPQVVITYSSSGSITWKYNWLAQRTSSSLTASGATVTAPAGYYLTNATKTIDSGTEGTPTATKGTVSNHSISVTPSVTNTAGYISGSTKTGTAVSVSASELVSGTKSITANGTNIDVTNYAAVDVSVTSSESDYTLTNIIPSQTVNCNTAVNSQAVRSAYFTNTPLLDDSKQYLVTFDGTKYVCEGAIEAGDWIYIGDSRIESSTDYLIVPFCICHTTDGTSYFIEVKTADAGNHTFQVDEIHFLGTGTTLQSKTITANGTYAASSDSVDGYSSVTVNIPTMTLPTSAAASATSGYTSKATISRSTSDQYINIPTGYNSAGAYYKISATANGSVTAPASITGTSATVSTGTGTLTLTKTVSVTPNVTTAGYISSGTAGNSEISLTASVTIDPTPTASGATVTIPAGYYSAQTTKSVTTMTLPTSASSSATSGYTSKATISRSTSDQYINIAPGYNSAGGYYKISAVANGSATGPSSLSGSSATISTGTNTITLTKTGVTTTPTVSAGYVSSATASTATVALTASVTTKAATTYHPSTTDQTIASGTYTTGTQTIKAVTVLGLAANKVLSGTTVKIGDSTDDDCVTSVSGSVTFQTIYSGSSAPSSSTGVNGDVYIQT